MAGVVVNENVECVSLASNTSLNYVSKYQFRKLSPLPTKADTGYITCCLYISKHGTDCTCLSNTCLALENFRKILCN